MSQQQEETNSTDGLLFIKEVAKYFMDFLETDFHKHRLPRRNVTFHNSDNLLVGVTLEKYPSFNKIIQKLINKGFEKEVIAIEKGVYKTNLPKNLLNLVKLQINKITVEQIDAVIESAANEVEKATVLHEKEYDVALAASLEEVSGVVRGEIVKPFIENIEKPLRNLELGDEENIFIVEEELVAVLLHLLENKISEVINLLLVKEAVNIKEELQSVFFLQDIKSNLNSFFEDLQVADLFQEIFEMERNKNILDKQDFYLYFGDISFNKTKYPIFYIPMSVLRDGDVLTLEFDSQAYINKKVLEYIVQEYNVQKGTKGTLQTVSERIIYLAQRENEFIQLTEAILNEIYHFFELDGNVSFLDEEVVSARSSSVKVSNHCYICLFDKSDEALVNDYEEILQQLSQEGGVLAETFNRLIEDFVHKNPTSFNGEVEDGWDNTDTQGKLVYPSPIPLNSEQRQILSAVGKDNCKYIIVEGPPGTGKSHTITAIVFDAILKNQSVLVLSDKKEALDVVEENITKTMNKVRYDKNFQNPILRLGKTGNTYNSILAKSAIEGIKTYYRAVKAVKKDYETVEQSITKSANALKEDLEAEILSYDDIDIQEIREFFDLELYFKDKDLIFDFEELAKHEDSVIEMEDFRNSVKNIRSVLASDDLAGLCGILGVEPESIQSAKDFQDLLHFLACALESLDKIRENCASNIVSLKRFSHLDKIDLDNLRYFIEEYSKIKSSVFGFLFSGKKVEELDEKFKQTFVQSSFLKPHEELQELKSVEGAYSFVEEIETDFGKKGPNEFDYVALAHHLLTNENEVVEGGNFHESIKTIISVNEDIKYLQFIAEKYPSIVENLGIHLSQFSTVAVNNLTDIAEAEFDKQMRFLYLKQKVSKDFSKIMDLNYANRMRQIEDLVTTQVTYLLDGRLINFYENNKGDAATLRTIIKSKQRFPREEFSKLKEAFPCILAGIRDYAEYIPLEPEMFDLVIIDEASQVSIAQAFPALLRAKKVLILGDKKQFSNVKASQARAITNREYLNGLESCFRENVSTDTTKLVRAKKFNIQTSILDFFEFISNYTSQLLKHFRGYKEIISYSNKYFYQDSLQVMKIRGKSIDEVIKFSYVEPSKEDEVYPNANLKEVEFIIDELKRLKEEGRSPSVGIITPHTNQHKLLEEKIRALSEWDYFSDNLHLKMMTFDTCQGEERDIIYYSMVASSHSDKLWGVFIKELSKVDTEEDGQIKAQRLNVGFSRAKECMHFVLSKPLENFNGSAGEALKHYKYVLDEARKERSVTEVDANSKMEPEVMNWFYQTDFWKQHKDDSEFIPQFEIGKYLKQLDRSYTHPAYTVDFLLIYVDERHREHKIIIEYDGFQEHFKNVDEVNEFNYEHYYSSEDVYRQKVLEGYGYRFLRINKFNIGENPIANLDERIARLIKNGNSTNLLLNNIHETIQGLQNGDMRECLKCKEVRSLSEFKDPSLITGNGRFCNICKRGRNGDSTTLANQTEFIAVEDKVCTRCGSKMVLRRGKYGKFYGCSRFPYCRNTSKANS